MTSGVWSVCLQIILRLVDDADVKLTSSMPFDDFLAALVAYDDAHPPVPEDDRRDRSSKGKGKESKKRGRSGSRSRSRSHSRSHRSKSHSRSPSHSRSVGGDKAKSVDRGEEKGKEADAATAAVPTDDAAMATDATPSVKPITPLAKIRQEHPNHIKMVFEELIAEVSAPFAVCDQQRVVGVVVGVSLMGICCWCAG